MQTLSWRWSALHLQRRSACMGGCLGGYVRAPAALPTETPTNRAVQKKKRWQSSSARSSSQQQDQFWMSNSHEMDVDHRIMFHSKSVHDGVAASNNHNIRQEPSFENLALKDWHKQRQEWVGRHNPGQQQGLREPVIKWSSTYEELLGTSRPFTQPVPLPEMVDFLVDVWEQEGLYG